jgi:hypothetical protein
MLRVARLAQNSDRIFDQNKGKGKHSTLDHANDVFMKNHPLSLYPYASRFSGGRLLLTNFSFL